jgi:hypothetical protein
MLIGIPGTLTADQPPSYTKQVKPFLAKYCLECHNADKARGGLVLETFQSLRQGGDHGSVFVPGKPDESPLVLQVEGKAEPVMPPQKAKQPKPGEAAVLRAWVAAGAKDDTGTVVITLPDLKPRVPAAAPVAALAYRPDGKLLAAGGYGEVLLLDPATGDVAGKLPGQTAKVTALAFSRDGRHLAVASGAAGTAGQVGLYSLPPDGLPGTSPVRVLAAHKDLIHDVAFSPDGKTLATCSYDRLIKLWDVTTGAELRALKDHSDAAYGVAFSPDGRLLASAAADRAVKVWEVATGTRLYTLGESTDWLYAVAWSPDGRHLAAAGVDKSIRVWQASATGGKLVHSVFAHPGPITRLVYAADGKTLYSLSEDRMAKAWETGRMVETRVYARQPAATLALAVRPDHRQLAVGRYDGTLALLDEATGKVQSEPLPVKPKPPVLTKLSPSSGQRGQSVLLTLEGKYLETATELTASHPGVVAQLLPGSRTPTRVQAQVTFPDDTPADVYRLGLQSPLGQTERLPFTVDRFPPAAEAEPNDSPTTGQQVTLPVTLAGAIHRAGDVDFYRFEASAGQEIGVQVVPAAGSTKLTPVLQLTDAAGQVLAESSSGLLGYTCAQAGMYALGLRDRDYGGGEGMGYHLNLGDIPVVTAVYPLGLRRGTEAEIHLEGVHLGTDRSVRVKAPAAAAVGTRLPVSLSTPLGKPLGDAGVVVGAFPEVVRGVPGANGSDSLPLAVPGTANGRIGHPGATEVWRFAAQKGQRLILEVNARRLGSPLDSFLEVLEATGSPVPRATLRCLAKTYTTFRDHDSASPGIRIEAWHELAINDYLFVGSELLRIQALPKNPDDDCRFFSAAGQRLGYLDTTPTHQSMGTAMYKVAIHPPGTSFPPNGMPVIPLFYRNDDGGPGYGKDARLFFDPPADGDYLVRIGDARGQGGRGYAYRLTVRPPEPSFTVKLAPSSPSVWKGGAVPVTVSAERLDGFDEAIDVRLENLPAGFTAPATTIPAGENSTAFALWAEPTATTPVKAPPFKLVARASIHGTDVVREVTGGTLKAVDPGDIVTTTEQAEVTVVPGGEVRMTVKVERRNGFKGRIPIDVRGLPHGVRVLDIGLNGILITERDTRRTFVLYAEPWVQPTEHPFVVLARREGKNTEHAAKSVLLKVVNGSRK